ncbi:hypothetical protein [Vibrio sp. M260118]|uniref:hypothetical protein n=1 Tax=Vibrio sp. M260118 TaxID=3020896 RepID=UPI002F41F18E
MKLNVYNREVEILANLQKANPSETLTALLNRVIREYSQHRGELLHGKTNN